MSGQVAYWGSIPPGDGDGKDSGSGTVIALGTVLGAIVLFLGVLLLVQATIGAARAAAAADLAALAGADTIRGLRSGDPCGVAAEVAARNAAELSACVPDPGARTVVVWVEASAASLLPWRATAQARAGPPGPLGSREGVQ
ncbi:Rv3654c family TadE-like protein [Arthrobacter sp. Edens01]|uniref:Rv3654c family TadE-like protein n=1 Tax=Arthrobacter sp. Edens01 TaxID=1732020 RepID=UPI000ADC9076|nr:Rv3654c family TadE-like protein [Arthrobacter sp. Edens01]